MLVDTSEYDNNINDIHTMLNRSPAYDSIASEYIMTVVNILSGRLPPTPCEMSEVSLRRDV